MSRCARLTFLRDVISPGALDSRGRSQPIRESGGPLEGVTLISMTSLSTGLDDEDEGGKS